jgi:hypothetical protein
VAFEVPRQLTHGDLTFAAASLYPRFDVVANPLISNVHIDEQYHRLVLAAVPFFILSTKSVEQLSSTSFVEHFQATCL